MIKNTKGYNEEFLIEEVEHIHQGKTSFEIGLMNTGKYGVLQIKLESWISNLLLKNILNNGKSKVENVGWCDKQITYFEVEINNEKFIVEQWLDLNKYSSLDVRVYNGDYFIYRPMEEDNIF